MISVRTALCVATAQLLLFAATAQLRAQATGNPGAQVPAPASPPVQPSAPAPSTPHYNFNRNNLFLDAAHGGSDDGARIGDRLLEKEFTLALSNRIANQLNGQDNLNLVLTRQSGAGDPAIDGEPAAPAPDARAGMANHAHPFACVLLHATGTGSGVHIVTSELAPPDPTIPITSATPWATAQANWVRQSLRLANEVGLSLQHAGVPVYLTHASVRPLDSLTCPAIAIEVAPPRPAADPSSISDPNYQQRIATAIAAALVSWRSHLVNTAALPPSTTPKPAIPQPQQAPAPAAKAVPSPAPTSPRPATISPTAPVIRRPPPAPIERRPPPTTPQPQQVQPDAPPPGARL